MIFILSFALSLLVGCSQTGPLNEVNISLVRIQKITLATLPWGPASKSPDGRVFVSNFYDAYRPQIQPNEKALFRYYAKVSIIGDRRPYNLVVEVFKERRTGPPEMAKFELVGIDTEATKSFKQLLRLRLEGKNPDRDFIDDFKAF